MSNIQSPNAAYQATNTTYGSIKYLEDVTRIHISRKKKNVRFIFLYQKIKNHYSNCDTIFSYKGQLEIAVFTYGKSLVIPIHIQFFIYFRLAHQKQALQDGLRNNPLKEKV
jgi:hypothetical protein